MFQAAMAKTGGRWILLAIVCMTAGGTLAVILRTVFRSIFHRICDTTQDRQRSDHARRKRTPERDGAPSTCPPGTDRAVA